jgi:hypothetical protein
MNCLRFAQILPAILLLALSSGKVLADCGIIRLREAQGPFVITIFTASEPERDSPVDLSVMVQRRDSSEAVLDATVDLTLTAPDVPHLDPMDPLCGQPAMVLLGQFSEPRMTQFTVAATREQASNKLLYAAPITFVTDGNWRLQAIIKRGSEVVKVCCDIPISPPARGFTKLIPYLALPPSVVVVFAFNQRLRKQSFGKPSRAI